MGTLSGLTCPHCGAPLATAKSGILECAYCGSAVANSETINTCEARQFGQELELGRYDAQNTIPGSELAAKIKALLKPVEELKKTAMCISELDANTAAADAELKCFRKSGKAKLILIPLLVLFLSSGLFGSGESRILISPLLTVLTFVFLFLARRRKKRKLEKAVSSCKEKYQDACTHLEWLYDTYDYNLIPDDYLETEPMAFFIKVLNNGRAMSLNQAINLYEDDKHRKELLKLKTEQNKLQAQQIELQRQHLKEERLFREKQLEIAKQKKAVDWGTVLTTAGSVAAIALSIKNKRK